MSKDKPKLSELSEKELNEKLNRLKENFDKDIVGQKSYAIGQIFNNAKSGYKVNDANSAPKVNDANSAPKVNDSNSAPKVNDSNSAPKVNDSNSAPKVNDSNSAPKVFKIDKDNESYKNTIKSMLDSAPKEGQDAKSAEVIIQNFKTKRDEIKEAAAAKGYKIDETTLKSVNDESLKEVKDKLRAEFEDIDKVKILVAQSAMKEQIGFSVSINDQKESENIKKSLANKFELQTGDKKISDGAIPITPKMYDALMDLDNNHPTKINIRLAIQKASKVFESDKDPGTFDPEKVNDDNMKKFSKNFQKEYTHLRPLNDRVDDLMSKKNLTKLATVSHPVGAASVVAVRATAKKIESVNRSEVLDQAKKIGKNLTRSLGKKSSSKEQKDSKKEKGESNEKKPQQQGRSR